MGVGPRSQKVWNTQVKHWPLLDSLCAILVDHFTHLTSPTLHFASLLLSINGFPPPTPPIPLPPPPLLPHSIPLYQFWGCPLHHIPPTLSWFFSSFFYSRSSWSDHMVPLFSTHMIFTTSVAGAALHAMRTKLSDHSNVLQSWDPTLVNPCTWFHVTCDSNDHVARLSVPPIFTTSLFKLSSFFFFAFFALTQWSLIHGVQWPGKCQHHWPTWFWARPAPTS